MAARFSGTPGGHRLRALREYVGKTQLEVELDARLGTGYLQRVESGKVRHPEADTLERILAALGARYTERRDVLELFGYVVTAPLPDADEIAWAVEACRSELNEAVFPAYLLDCAHRLLAWNPLVPKLFDLQPLARSQAANEPLSMLRVIFDPAHGVTARIANPDIFFPAQIRALRYEMRFFRRESWYQTLIEDMLQCEVFARYWAQTDAGSAVQIAARPLAPLELMVADEERLQFRLMAEPFAQDRRFRVIYDVPAEPATIQRCIAWLQAATEH